MLKLCKSTALPRCKILVSSAHKVPCSVFWNIKPEPAAQHPLFSALSSASAGHWDSVKQHENWVEGGEEVCLRHWTVAGGPEEPGDCGERRVGGGSVKRGVREVSVCTDGRSSWRAGKESCPGAKQR